MNRPLLLAALSTSLGLTPLAAQAADITLDLTGKGLKGSEIRVAIYNDPGDLLDEPRAVAKQTQTANGNAVTFIFHDLLPGRYAVTSFADGNHNQTLDRGLFGIPSEAYGFSRDARGRFGPPVFEDAAFDLPPEGVTLSFSLH